MIMGLLLITWCKSHVLNCHLKLYYMRIVRWIIGLYCLFVGLILEVDVIMVLCGAKTTVHSSIGTYYRSPIVRYNPDTTSNIGIAMLGIFALIVAFMMYYITVMNRGIEEENRQIKAEIKKMKTVPKKKPAVK